MGLRERLQMVTKFFQNAAGKGHKLREDEERGESHAPSGGEKPRPRDEQRLGGTAADEQTGTEASRQSDRAPRA